MINASRNLSSFAVDNTYAVWTRKHFVSTYDTWYKLVNILYNAYIKVWERFILSGTLTFNGKSYYFSFLSVLFYSRFSNKCVAHPVTNDDQA